jgi:hypothetical protein
MVLTTAAQYDAALAVFEQAITTYQAAGNLEGLQRTLAAIGQAHARRGTPEEGVRRLQPLLDQQAMTATRGIPGPGRAVRGVGPPLFHEQSVSGAPGGGRAGRRPRAHSGG